MPIIGSPYSGSGSIADSLRSLGESMFGNQALHEVQRQTAGKYARENSSANASADALQRGDYRTAMSEFARGGRGGADWNQYYLGGRAQEAGGNIDDPNFNTAVTAAHGIGAAPIGQRRQLA